LNIATPQNSVASRLTDIFSDCRLMFKDYSGIATPPARCQKIWTIALALTRIGENKAHAIAVTLRRFEQPSLMENALLNFRIRQSFHGHAHRHAGDMNVPPERCS
tara:strand:- start:533 stop:847 length:315 start_codon:yes stop_codon:yes gene_type:complete